MVRGRQSWALTPSAQGAGESQEWFAAKSVGLERGGDLEQGGAAPSCSSVRDAGVRGSDREVGWWPRLQDGGRGETGMGAECRMSPVSLAE